MTWLTWLTPHLSPILHSEREPPPLSRAHTPAADASPPQVPSVPPPLHPPPNLLGRIIMNHTCLTWFFTKHFLILHSEDPIRQPGPRAAFPFPPWGNRVLGRCDFPRVTQLMSGGLGKGLRGLWQPRAGAQSARRVCNLPLGPPPRPLLAPT